MNKHLFLFMALLTANANATLTEMDYACVIVNRADQQFVQGMDITSVSDEPADVEGINIADLVCATGFCNVLTISGPPNRVNIGTGDATTAAASFYSGSVCRGDTSCTAGQSTYLAVAHIGQPFAAANPIPVPSLPATCQ